MIQVIGPPLNRCLLLVGADCLAWLAELPRSNVPALHHHSNKLSGQVLLSLTLLYQYSNIRKYAHPLHVKEGIITEQVFLVFSESFFWTCFGLVMYIWELMGVTEKLAFQM